MTDRLDLVQLRQDILHDFSLEISEMSVIKEQPGGSATLSGRLADDEVIVRLAKGSNRAALEVWAFRQYARLGLPVPRVVAYQERPARIGHPTIVVTRLKGQLLGTIRLPLAHRTRIYHQLGQTMRRMHEVRVEGFGRLWVDVDSGLSIGLHGSWRDFWRMQLDDNIVPYLRRQRLIGELEARALLDTRDVLEGAELERAVFVHNDLHQGNVLVDGGRISGILDPVRGFAGDPRLDIAVAFLWLNGWQRRAFAGGYGSPALDPWVGRYHTWVAAQKLVSRHEPHRDGSPTVERSRRLLIEALHEPWPPPEVVTG